MNRKKIGITFASLIVAASFAGCGSSTKVAESKSGETVKKVEQVSDDDLDTYFDDFASGDPDKMESGQALTAPDSLAEAYLIHQAALGNAFLDGGSGTSEQSVSKMSAGYKVCDPESDAKDPCATYGDFKSVGGKLSSFTVSGEDLTDRLTIGKGSAVKAGSLASVKFISSYQSVSNYLFVVLEIKSADQKLTLSSFDAKYRAPDGRQSTATSADGPTDLEDDSKANIVIVFEKAQPGGEISLAIADENYNTEKTVKIKIG